MTRWHPSRRQACGVWAPPEEKPKALTGISRQVLDAGVVFQAGRHLGQPSILTLFLIVEVAVLSPLADAISRCPFRPRRGLRLRRSPVGSDASTSRAEPTERAGRRFRAGRIWLSR